MGLIKFLNGFFTRGQQETKFPYHMKDEHGNRVRFERCTVDPLAFKKRLIEQKVEGHR